MAAKAGDKIEQKIVITISSEIINFFFILIISFKRKVIRALLHEIEHWNHILSHFYFILTFICKQYLTFYIINCHK